MLCAVLMAHLHASVVPHTAPGHTARSLLLLLLKCSCQQHPTSITRQADCLSREHVSICIAVLSIVAAATVFPSFRHTMLLAFSLACTKAAALLFRRCCRSVCWISVFDKWQAHSRLH